MATSMSSVIRVSQSFRKSAQRARERHQLADAAKGGSVDTLPERAASSSGMELGPMSFGREYSTSSMPDESADVDLEERDPKKRTVDDEELHQACQEGDYDGIKRILRRPGIHLNMVDEDGVTPLMKAVRWGHYKIVHLLLDWGADIDHVDKMWRTAWYFAAFSSVAPVGRHWRCMLELCSSVPIQNLTPEIVLTACFSNQSRVLNVLLEHFERKILSRDSTNFCKFEFHDLYKLDDDEVQVTWPDGSKSKRGSTALMALIDKVKKRALVHPTIRGLILWKWNKYAKYQFYIELALHTLSVACLSGNAAMLRFQELEHKGLGQRVGDLLVQSVALAISTFFWLQDMANFYFKRKRGQSESVLRYSGSIIAMSLNLVVMLLFLVDSFEVSARMASGLPSDMSNGLSLSRVYMFRVYAMTVVWLWLRFFTYLELVSWIGAFFIMVERIMREDLTRWAIVVLVSMPGFSLAFNLIFDVVLSNFEADPTTDPVILAEVDRLRSSYVGWDRAIYGQFLIMFSLDSWPRGQSEPISALLLIGFVLMLNLISVNLLIAMMTSTYEAVKEDALPEWNFRQARYILERSYWFSRDFVRYKPEYGAYKFTGYYHLVFPNLKEDHEHGNEVVDAMEEKEPLDMESFIASQAEMTQRINALQSLVETLVEQQVGGGAEKFAAKPPKSASVPRFGGPGPGIHSVARALEGQSTRAPSQELRESGHSGAVLDDINRILEGDSLSTAASPTARATMPVGDRQGPGTPDGTVAHPLGVPIRNDVNVESSTP